MKQSNKILGKFNPEELEQRFEMGWLLNRDKGIDFEHSELL